MSRKPNFSSFRENLLVSFDKIRTRNRVSFVPAALLEFLENSIEILENSRMLLDSSRMTWFLDTNGLIFDPSGLVFEVA